MGCCSKVVGELLETVCEAPGVACPSILGETKSKLGSSESVGTTAPEVTTTANAEDNFCDTSEQSSIDPSPTPSTTNSHGARAFSPLTATLSVSLLALISRHASLAA